MSSSSYTYLFLCVLIIVGVVLMVCTWQINSQVPEACWGASKTFKNSVLGIYTIGLLFIILPVYTIGWIKVMGNGSGNITAPISFYIAFTGALSLTLIILCSQIDAQIKKYKSQCTNAPLKWLQTTLALSVIALCVCVAYVGYQVYLTHTGGSSSGFG